MRLLLISNTPFLPPTAGNRVRIGEMLAFLQAHEVEVGLLMLPAADVAEWDVEAMRARCAFLEVARPPRTSALISRLRRTFGVPDPASPVAVDVDAWCPPWFRARAAEVAQRWAPDVLLVEYVFLSACIPAVQASLQAPPLAIIDTHDIMHHRHAAYAAADMAPQWFHTTPDEERRGLARADTILAIQEEDAATLRGLVPDRSVLTVPHGEEIRPADPALAEPGRLLFVASRNDLNVHGLRWFLADVWPRIRAAVPGARLAVCGTIAEKLGTSTDLPDGIEVRGALPSLDAEYQRARLVVNPVLGGTGLKIKVVEALCHGRPVLSTAAGLGGVAAGEAAGVLVADTATAFVDAAVRVLADATLAGELARAAGQQAASRFSRAAAFTPLLEHMRRGRQLT